MRSVAPILGSSRFPIGLPGLVLSAFLLAAPFRAAAQTRVDPVPGNPFCPVLTKEPASPDHTLLFRGKLVGFCDETCKQEFLNDPDRYLKNLPAFGTLEDETSRRPRANVRAPQPDFLEYLAAQVRSHLYLLGFTAIALTAFFVARQVKWRRKARGEPRRKSKWVALAARPSTLLIVLQFGLILHLMTEVPEASEPSPVFHRIDDETVLVWKLLDRQAAIWQQTLRERESGIPPRLAARYTLAVEGASPPEISLETVAADGGKVEAGSAVAGRPLSLQVAIRPGGRFAEFHESLERAVLIAHGRYDPEEVLPRVGEGYRLFRHGETWEGQHPLDKIGADERGNGELEGTVYLCFPRPSQTGVEALNSAEYAIAYRIALREGKVTTESRLWLASLGDRAGLPRLAAGDAIELLPPPREQK